MKVQVSDIARISAKKFWQTLRVPAERKNTEKLARAIRLGRGGKNRDAWRLLGEYHREALANEWNVRAESARTANLLPKTELRDLYRNRINVWHNLVIDFGPEIDWHRQHLGKNIPGFHYFAWFAPAVHHFIQTKDAEAGAWIKKTLLSYFKALPGLSKNFTADGASSGLPFDCLCCRGKEGIVPTAYLALLQQELDPELIGACVRLFLGMGRAMKRRMDYEATQRKKANGNISVAGVHALFILSRIFPEFSESASWTERAQERFSYFADESFFADGGYCERVWGYGVGALSYLSGSWLAAQRYGGLGAADKKLRQALLRAFRWYAKTLGPRERQPTFGDGEPSPRITRNAMDLAEKVFPEKGRYLGVDRTKSYLLKPSGFAILRNGDDADSVYLNLSFAKYAGWHSHYEQLSLNLWAFDTPIIEELDRWGPYHNPLDILVRAPEAHNQFLVDGMVFDPRYEDAFDIGWFSNEKVDCFTGAHRAYRFEVFAFKGPGTFNMNGVVRRTVILVKDAGYVLVMDSVYDENHSGFNRGVSQYWHSPFPFVVLGKTDVRTQGEVGCHLSFAREHGLRRLECTTDFAGDEVEYTGQYSERYSLRARRWGRVEEAGMPGFATLLQPFKGALPEAVIRPLPTENGEPYRAEGYEIITPFGTDRLLLNPEKRREIICDGEPVTGRGLLLLGNNRGRFTWQ